VSAEEVWVAYIENFELVLPHIKDIATDIDGKTVITSDHGNSFGRFGVYGHPPGLYLADLVAVPWLELPYDERRPLSKGDIYSTDTTKAVKKQLRDLGYR